jgi:transposase
MLTDVLFPAELQLRVDGVEMEKNTVNISVASTNGRSVCPHCQTISERIHSSYNRHPADLPLADYTVRLGMAVHRFFCDNGDCEAKTFTERIPAFIQHYARRTDRLAIKQQSVATADEFPIYAGKRKRSDKLNPYMDHMTKRWDEGCHNATQFLAVSK